MPAAFRIRRDSDAKTATSRVLGISCTGRPVFDRRRRTGSFPADASAAASRTVEWPPIIRQQRSAERRTIRIRCQSIDPCGLCERPGGGLLHGLLRSTLAAPVGDDIAHDICRMQSTLESSAALAGPLPDLGNGPSLYLRPPDTGWPSLDRR